MQPLFFSLPVNPVGDERGIGGYDAFIFSNHFKHYTIIVREQDLQFLGLV